MRETIEQLPDFVRVAAETGVKEVYLQRLVFFAENAIGNARPDQALYERMSGDEATYIDRAAELATSLGMTFSASGAASEPGMSLKRGDGGASPWSLCRRPWTVMYITANGRALPCCIAPFSQRGYENYTLGDATQQKPARNLERRGLPRLPPRLDVGPAAGRLRQLRTALEPLTTMGRRRRHSDFERGRLDRRRRHRDPARRRRSHHRRRWRQQRRHGGGCPPRRCRHHCRRSRLWPRLSRRCDGSGERPTSSSLWTVTAPTIRPPSPA